LVIFGGLAHFILQEREEYFIKTGAGYLSACFRGGQELLFIELGQIIFMEGCLLC